MTDLRELLIDFGRCERRVNAALRERFSSCFASEDWLRANASSEEWMDYLRYRSELAIEIMLSRTPESITLADPGQYTWNSADITRRVTERFQNHGPARALFLESRTRHLVKLTKVEQRLSKVQELSTEADQEERARLFEEFWSRRAKEVNALIKCFPPEELREYGARPQAFARFYAARVLARLRTLSLGDVSGPRSATDSISLLVDERFRWIVEPLIDFYKPGPLKGGIHLRMYLHDMVDRTLKPYVRDDGFMPYFQTLPGEFNAYSRFDDADNLSVCCEAWAECVIQTVMVLRDAGRRICIESRVQS